MKRKILIVSQASYFAGGKAKFTQTIIDELKKNLNYHFILLETTRSSRKKSKFSNSNFFLKLLKYLIRTIEVVFKVISDKFRFIKIILKEKPDFIQIHSSSFNDFYDNSIYIILSKFVKAKLILRIGGGGFKAFYESRSGVLKYYIKKLLNKNNILVCQSEYWKVFFISLGVKEQKIEIIPNFIDMKEWECEIDKDITNKDIIKLLFIPGKEEVVKGYYDVMPVFKEISKYLNIQLILVGLQKKIEDEYSELVKDHKIIKYDHIAGESKLEIFKRSDIFILPSYFEGFPNSLLEAMAAELPIIVTNIPSVKSILDNGAFVNYVTPGNREEIKNAIIELYNNNEKRKKMVVQNLEFCKLNFSIEKINGYFDKLYC